MARRNKRGNVVDDWMNHFRPNQAADRTALYEEMYVRVLTEIATNRFRWEGLPATIDRRFLEIELFRSALVVFFWDNDFDKFFALRGSGAGRWNMYDNPVSFNVTGNGVYPGKLIDVMAKPDPDTGERDPLGGCIPIWANTLRTPDWDIVYLMSTKLAQLERTIEITAQAMRTPYLFAVDDNEKHSFMNIWRQLQEGQMAIFGTTALGRDIEEKIKLFDLGIDKDVLINLQVAKSKMWNETMTLLGINNANQDKRERLVADEVSANDNQIEAVRNSALAARQYAVELINEKYSLNVSVDWNETVPLGQQTGGVDELEDENSGDDGNGGSE